MRQDPKENISDGRFENEKEVQSGWLDRDLAGHCAEHMDDLQRIESQGIAKIPNVKDGVVLGLDLVGGAEITYEADLEGADVSAEELSEGMKAAQTMLRERLTTFGYTEADVYLSGRRSCRRRDSQY